MAMRPPIQFPKPRRADGSTITSTGSRHHRSALQPTARWGSAVVETRSTTRVHEGARSLWSDAGAATRAIRREALRPPTSAAAAIQAACPAGTEQLAHSRIRIRHAFELFGSCMLIIALLAVALLI